MSNDWELELTAKIVISEPLKKKKSLKSKTINKFNCVLILKDTVAQRCLFHHLVCCYSYKCVGQSNRKHCCISAKVIFLFGYVQLLNILSYIIYNLVGCFVLTSIFPKTNFKDVMAKMSGFILKAITMRCMI